MINSLLLKIKYKLYVSILFTPIPFVFALIFKFIVRGPNPSNSPLYQYIIKCIKYIIKSCLMSVNQLL